MSAAGWRDRHPVSHTAQPGGNALKSLIRLFIVLPIAIIVIMLAVANRRSVPVSFNPLDPENPATIFEIPLFWLVFACVALGVVLGGIAVWFKQGKHRKAARQNRNEAARWRAETDRQREKLNAVTTPQQAALPPASRSRSAA
ncbi:MAG: LapA family protein [Pseudomonadota bacterium]